MVKVNDQMVNQETDKKADFSNRLIKFEKNDSLIASNLESQTSNVNSRLVQRKMNSKIRSSGMNSQLNGTTLFGKDSFMVPQPKIDANKIHKSEKVISDTRNSQDSNEILAE